MKIVEQIREMLVSDPKKHRAELSEMINQYFSSPEVEKMCSDVKKPDYTCLNCFMAFSYKPKLDEFLEVSVMVCECLSRRVLIQHDISNALMLIVDLLNAGEIRNYIQQGVDGYECPGSFQFLLKVDFHNLGYYQ